MIELIAAMSIFLFVVGGSLTALEVFDRESRNTRERTDAIDQSRVALATLAKQLRNLALPTNTSQSIDLRSSYDLIFKTSEPSRRRVRYCLSSSTTNATLWQQVQTAGNGDTPLTATMYDQCPDTVGGSAWGSQRAVADNVVNRQQSQPLFTYDQPSTVTDVSKIRRIDMSVFVDPKPTRNPPPAELSSGVFLRNQNQVPTACFVSQRAGTGAAAVVLSASCSTDPEARTLAINWFMASTATAANRCPLRDSSGALPSGVSFIGQGLTFTRNIAAGSYVTVEVKDPGDLYSCMTRQV